MSFPAGKPHPAAKRERNRRIREEAAKGRTYNEIADEFGISRQRVDQIVKPARARARDIANRAMQAGKLKRPTRCAVCGSTENVESHHPDYDKPLDITGLCVACHRIFHGRQEKRVPAKFQPVPVECPVCGQVWMRRPYDARHRGPHCNARCAGLARRLTEEQVEARFQAMGERLQRYALAHGYVPIAHEFAMHVTGATKNQCVPRLTARLDPNRRECGSYKAVMDRLYHTAGFERPDGRTTFVRRAREKRGLRQPTRRSA